MNTLVRLVNYLRFSHLDSTHFGGSYEERERFNTGIFISPERDFLFTKNEKCGNNTARRTLQNLASRKPLPPDFRDVNRWAWPMLLPSDLGLKRVENLNARIPFKFAIVRNPYARTLSCYIDKFSHGRVNPTGLGIRLGADTAVDFAGFVERICAQEPAQMDPHWRIQYFNICFGLSGTRYRAVGQHHFMNEDLLMDQNNLRSRGRSINLPGFKRRYSLQRQRLRGKDLERG